MEQRPTWLEYFKQIVLVTATRSPCTRLQVGCLLVKDNRIISQGYNGFLPGCPHESIVRDNHEQATLHAEQNALMDCAKRGVSCEGCTAYITHYPCIICTRLLLSGGIKHIKYLIDENGDIRIPNVSENSLPIIRFESYTVLCGFVLAALFAATPIKRSSSPKLT